MTQTTGCYLSEENLTGCNPHQRANHPLSPNQVPARAGTTTFCYSCKMVSTARLLRIVKTVLVSVIGIQSFIIVLGNLTDYDTNYQFVEHVLKMDTIFSSSKIQSRSLDSPIFFHACYGLVILAEALMSACCLRGSWLLIKHLTSDPITFQGAKSWAVAGITIGILIWFLGFEVIGGEWFGMWQSTRWNGLASAERMVSFLMLTLIFLQQHDE